MLRRSLSRQLRASIYVRDRWLCRYCGVEILFSPALKLFDDLAPGHGYYSTHGSRPTMAKLLFDRCACVDHIQCVRALGENDPQNLVAACWSCNLQKSASCDDSWRERLIPIERLSPTPGWDGLVGIMRRLDPSNAWLRYFADDAQKI